MTARSRAHRTLRKLESYHAIDDEIPDEYTQYRKLLGNVVGKYAADDRTGNIYFFEKGIICSKWDIPFLPYINIEKLKMPDQKDSEYLVIETKIDDRHFRIYPSKRNDLFEILRYLMRVKEDIEVDRKL